MTTDLQVQKQEVDNSDTIERTRPGKVYVPRADIYADADHIFVIADIPGADENSVEITLEKGILTIDAHIEPNLPENYDLAYAEYEVGDYQRSFKISDEIDQENIQATVKNGVLTLQLPKATVAKPRKIAVKAA